jgi:hypothetical protein
LNGENQRSRVEVRSVSGQNEFKNQLDSSAQAPLISATLTFSCSVSLLVLRDQLIGDVIQICTDDLRLWGDSQDVVARPIPWPAPVTMATAFDI